MRSGFGEGSCLGTDTARPGAAAQQIVVESRTNSGEPPFPHFYFYFFCSLVRRETAPKFISFYKDVPPLFLTLRSGHPLYLASRLPNLLMLQEIRD